MSGGRSDDHDVEFRRSKAVTQQIIDASHSGTPQNDGPASPPRWPFWGRACAYTKSLHVARVRYSMHFVCWLPLPFPPPSRPLVTLAAYCRGYRPSKLPCLRSYRLSRLRIPRYQIHESPRRPGSGDILDCWVLWRDGCCHPQTHTACLLMRRESRSSSDSLGCKVV